MGFLDSLFLVIPQAFYWLVSNALMMVEIFQFLFRKLAGLDTYYLNGEKIEKSGDLVLQIIQKTFFSGENNEYSVIAVTFWSIVILASILLFVTTIAAIIKIEYSPAKTNPGEPKSKGTSKGKIVGNFLKAIISFVVVPIACYFGLFLGNAVLFAIDSATNVTTTNLISVDSGIYNKIESENDTYIFNIFFGEIIPANTTPLAGLANRVALYSANRARNDKNYYETVILYEESADGTTTNFEIFNIPDNQDDAADLIDTMFLMNAKLKTPETLDVSKAPTSSFAWGTPTSQIEYFDRYNIGLVNYYYDLWKYNFIVAIFFVWVLAKTMITFTFGLITRIFSLLALLMVGPLVMSMMPIDGGSGLSSWSKSFVEKAISAYTAVFSMNILFMIIPIFQTFGMFGDSYYGGFPDLIVQMILIGAGLLAVAKVDEIVAKSLHSGSIYKDGGDLSKQVHDTYWKPIKNAGKSVADFAIGAGMAAATGGASLVGSGGSMASRLGGMVGSKFSHKGDKGNNGNTGNNENRTDVKQKEDTLSRRDRRDIATVTRSNDQMEIDALNSVEKDIGKEYDKNYKAQTNNAYQSYVSHGGEMSAKDFASSTSVGTYIDANSQWNSLGATGQSSYKDKDDFFKEYFDKNNKDGKVDFDSWKKSGQEKMQKDKGLSGGNAITESDIQKSMGDKNAYISKRRNEIYQQVQQKVANSDDEIAQKAIKNLEKETQKKIDAGLRLVKRKKEKEVENFKKIVSE